MSSREEEGVQGPLHLLDGLEPGTASLDAEVFVKEGTWNRSTMPLDWGRFTFVVR